MYAYKRVPAPVGILMRSMYRIKKISAQILEEKMQDAAVNLDDSAAKRDIMTLLVRARTAEKGEGYRMSDASMMDQVVSRSNFVQAIYPVDVTNS